MTTQASGFSISQRRRALGLTHLQMARRAKVTVKELVAVEAGMIDGNFGAHTAILNSLRTAEENALRRAADIMNVRDSR